MIVSTVERARGRWREILPQLGVEPRFLVNRHGPCPICGGKDRFRFDDKDGDGTWFCNQCRAGTGIILLRKLKGWSHKEACDAVDEIIGTGYRPPAVVPKAAAPVDHGSSARAAKRLLDEASASDVVEAYLTKRRLSVSAPALKGHPRCPYYVEEVQPDGRKHYRMLGSFPAILAPIVDRTGALIGVQRVYDADVDDRKKVMGDLKGGVVRLGQPTDELGVCEGFETGLAAYELFGIPIWAALTAGNLEQFEPPPGIVRLHVFGDSDESSVGQAAAFNLAVRVNRWNVQHKTGAEPVRVHLPVDLGTDWLDVLNGRARLDGD